jgi:nucleotide-binding universal stress UspA family protein
MTYRSLLVLIDDDPLYAARSQAAMTLAKAFDAHLVGLAPTGTVEVPSTPKAAASLAALASQAWEALREEAAQSAQAFQDACRAAGVKSFETLVDETDKAHALVRNARCSDLTVLSQADPGAPSQRAMQDLIEQVVLNSARPTLMLPYAGRFELPPRRVMVAWDDSTEAARAVSDALPVLAQARQVDIVSWLEPGRSPSEARVRARLERLQRWLGWHGVSAQSHMETVAGGSGIADAMLSRAADYQSELIVMGAYGHSRWSERLLGGATRGLLQAMTVPVLMSH